MRPRNLILLAVLGLLFHGCPSDLESPTEVSSESIIVLMGSKAIPADGVSEADLEAVIPKDADSGKRDVSFQTDLGQFVGARAPGNMHIVRADAEGRAKVQLRSGVVPGRATVTAKVDLFTDTHVVEFARAHASVITVEADNLSVTLDGSMKSTITARLGRDRGSVSTGTPVRLTAIQFFGDGSREVEVGRFTGLLEGVATSDGMELAKATFVADTGDVAPNRTVLIRVSTPSDDGQTLVEELTLSVK